MLRLGGEARINGDVRIVNDTSPLSIEPHQVAIVRTLETLNIPRFLIARWNLRVDMVYRGLLWVGALQVDPGWVGYLPCPLYNMSDKPIQLLFGEPVFTIDFVRTTPFRRDINRSYCRNEPVSPPLSTVDVHRLRSGPYDALTRVQVESGTLKSDLAAMRKHVDGSLAVMFTALAALVAALGIVAILPTSAAQGAIAKWPLLPLLISIGASVISIAAFWRTR